MTLSWLPNPTLQTVALGAAGLGAVSGGLGTFAVLRRQSLLGDAVSHAALPGVVLAFVLTGAKAPLPLMIGAALAGWLGSLAVIAVSGRTRVPYDSALGVVLSTFFGFGLLLLTAVQRSPNARHAGLDRYLLGQAATILADDLVTLLLLGGAALVLTAVFWKQFKLLSFDPEYAATIGVPVKAFDALLTGLLVLSVVIGLQFVGVVLMSALVVAPAAAARQWSDRLGVVVLLAACFGAASGLIGVLAGDALSEPGRSFPTGPAVVLVAVGIALASLAVRLVAARVRRLRRIGS